MDFKIIYANGEGLMTFDPVTTIANNIWLSLNIRKGSFFAAPEFGMRAMPGKNTEKSAELVEQYAKEALKWLIDTGKAKSISVSVERDVVKYPNRLILRGEAVQADDISISFEHFVEVV